MVHASQWKEHAAKTKLHNIPQENMNACPFSSSLGLLFLSLSYHLNYV